MSALAGGDLPLGDENLHFHIGNSFDLIGALINLGLWTKDRLDNPELYVNAETVKAFHESNTKT